jgi:branched-chain amino acid transport system ATP-binding protein
MTVRENLSLGRLARKTDGSHGVVWSEAQILDYFPRLKERIDVATDKLCAALPHFGPVSFRGAKRNPE